jgi:hypothetical protein
MDIGQAVLLALLAAAGFALGLLGARARPAGARAEAAFTGCAVGILVLVLWLTLSRAYLSVDSALDQVRDGSDNAGEAIRLGSVFLAGLLIAFALLAVLGHASRRPARVGKAVSTGGVLVTDAEAGQAVERTADAAPPAGTVTERAPDEPRLGLVLAAGIGLRNVAVGLALGASVQQGELDLTWVLVITLVLYNAFEGIGVAAALLTCRSRPGVAALAAVAAIAEVPLIAATAVGAIFTDDTLRVAFLAAAAGAVLYALTRLLTPAEGRPRHPPAFAVGIAVGLVAMFVATMLVTVAGAGA